MAKIGEIQIYILDILSEYGPQDFDTLYDYNMDAGDVGLSRRAVRRSLDGLISRGFVGRSIDGKYFIPEWDKNAKHLIFPAVQRG